ncbi:MAG: antitoxin [Jiangellaceae bacterium]
MRTTVTLDADVAALIHRAMQERGLTFKDAVNQAVRQGLTSRREQQAYRTPTFEMGQPRVSLDRALALAGEREDDEIVRKLDLRK